MFSTSDITATSPLALNSAASAAAKKEDTTKDQFLKMLVAQLKHQDPLQPPDASQFADQMTQFGQLEQLFNINGSLKGLSGQEDAANRFDAVSMIGKKIEAIGNGLEIGGEGAEPSDITFRLTQPAHEVTVVLKNEAGQIVRTLTYEDQEAGRQSHAFDGKNGQGQALSPGLYTTEITAVDAQGLPIPVDPLTIGTVTGVDFDASGVRLLLGSGSVYMNQVSSVRM